MQAAAYEALAEIRKRKEWLTHKSPEPWGAMLVSDNTRVLYGRDPGRVEERYLANVFGTYRAILEEHLPVTVTCDWNITKEELAKQKVLVLPNAACLSDEQCAAIRGYVKNGGGLIASLDTSLCNEFGDTREDFQLADVFGAHHRGVIVAGDGRKEVDVNFAKGLDDAYWEKRKNVFDLRIPIADGPFADRKLQELVGLEPVTIKGPAARIVVDADAKSLSVAFPKGSDEAKNTSPAIISRQFGKGRVVYFAAGIDAGYYSYSYPYQRRLISQAIRWAASEPPPVEVQAPMCVQSTVFRQEKNGQQRLLIHLYNNVNTTAFHGLPNDDVPLREETLPIHDIRVTLHGYDIASVKLQPEEKELPLKTSGEETSLIVQQLDVHSIVVAELK
jgi:type 1 glutamine amidotransferase